MSEQLHANKIGTLQLAALLILSRLFILLIYVPNTHNAVVGTPALLGILLGGVLTCRPIFCSVSVRVWICSRSPDNFLRAWER